MENSTREVNPLLLWSWHTPDFSLTGGTVDHQRSEYYKTVAGVPSSYKELSKRLGTDQFLWCYTQEDEYSVLPSDTKVKWALEVPKYHVLAIISSVAWHCIVWCNGGERGVVGTVPENCEPLWSWIAHRSGLKLGDFNKEFYRFWYAKTDKELWDALFLDKVHGDCTHVLLRHPVEKGWVRNRS